ncbi:alpha-protein kinase 2 isoform X1 [Hyperolius riggenbachi]|uniref:alpha-protein kinase 2 isoform X1 n=1 Tax=Hyperolius riggenbachi TaxID=752182 RepID=UPI0035A32B60
MVKLVSYNVKGLNSNKKRVLALKQFRESEADIILVQETHFKRGGSFTFASKHFPVHYTASCPTGKGGVAILFKRDMNIEVLSTKLDPKGRYIILKCKMGDLTFVLINLYAPNERQVAFISKVLAFWQDMDCAAVIVGGDFNVIHSPGLDWLSPNKLAPSAATINLAKSFRKLIRSYHLLDAVRIALSNQKRFTFYSPVHQTHTRIDHFLVSAPILRCMITAEIHDITWSDHAPISLQITTSLLKKKTFHWRLNESLLLNEDTKLELQSSLREFFELNEGSVDKLSILWEAHKAYIRGQCIALGSNKKKQRLLRSAALTSGIRRVELEYAQTPSLHLLKRLLEMRNELKDIQLAQANKSLLWSRQYYYEKANKPLTPMAKMLRGHTSAPIPDKIVTPGGKTLYDPQHIADEFSKFYKDLYSCLDRGRHPAFDANKLDQFLSRCRLPKLQKGDQDLLNAPITLAELLEAIKAIPLHKAPGPDGLPNVYYKTFQDILAPYMVRLFNNLMNGLDCPQYFGHSFISVILKSGKDETACGSYRPIALLNTDYKVFTKILATRLASILPDLIDKDQVGFTYFRQAGDNTRRTISLIDSVNHTKTPALLLSLDAEKAFDRLSWPYMFSLLKHLGFSGSFATALSLLYSAPTAQIKLPSVASDPFQIINGTRQGCPLSPLLFVLCIEPLASAIRESPDVMGICVGSKQFKLSLFADDILLTLTNPLTTLPCLHRILVEFGALSGYKVNSSKTEALPINISLEMASIIKASFPYRWCPSSIKYLGIHLTSTYDSLYSVNYIPLLAEVRRLLKTWSPLKLSLLGRICSISMSILPKLLYLFETLPVKVPFTTLTALQKDILHYIWLNKSSRIPRSVMLTRREHGGLGVPDITKYYLAAHLRHVISWTQLHAFSKWMQIEKLWLAPVHPCSLLWSSRLPDTVNPLLRTMHFTKNIWHYCSSKFPLTTNPSSLVNVIFNPLIPNSSSSLVVKGWSDGNIFQLRHLLDPISKTFVSADQLSQRVNLTPALRFNFHQIKHYAKSLGNSDFTSSPTPFESLCNNGPTQTHLISSIYKILCAFPADTLPSHRYMEYWSRALSMDITAPMWSKIWQSIAKSTQCSIHKENHYKILLLWYRTPDKLHRWFPNTSPTCWRCKDKLIQFLKENLCPQEGTVQSNEVTEKPEEELSEDSQELEDSAKRPPEFENQDDIHFLEKQQESIKNHDTVIEKELSMLELPVCSIDTDITEHGLEILDHVSEVVDCGLQNVDSEQNNVESESQIVDVTFQAVDNGSPLGGISSYEPCGLDVGENKTSTTGDCEKGHHDLETFSPNCQAGDVTNDITKATNNGAIQLDVDQPPGENTTTDNTPEMPNVLNNSNIALEPIEEYKSLVVENSPSADDNLRTNSSQTISGKQMKRNASDQQEKDDIHNKKKAVEASSLNNHSSSLSEMNHEAIIVVENNHGGVDKKPMSPCNENSEILSLEKTKADMLNNPTEIEKTHSLHDKDYIPNSRELSQVCEDPDTIRGAELLRAQSVDLDQTKGASCSLWLMGSTNFCERSTESKMVKKKFKAGAKDATKNAGNEAEAVDVNERYPPEEEKRIKRQNSSDTTTTKDSKKAPKLTHCIQAEMFPDSSGNLKLFCQFGEIHADSTITWTKDSKLLARMHRTPNDDSPVSLAIVQTTKKDQGVYHCMLKNMHGKVTTDFHLTAEVLEQLARYQDSEGGEEIEFNQLLFREDFITDMYFGGNLHGRIATEELHFGEGVHRKAFRSKVMCGLLPVFNPGHLCVLKVHNAIAYGTKTNDELVQKNYKLAVQECYVQNTAREYAKIYAAEAEQLEDFGRVPEVIPIFLIHRPANNIPYATVEEELLGDFVKYSIKDGKEINVMRKESEAGQKCCTFQHWVYERTNGNLLVTDMQGVGMKLTDIGIATLSKGYRGFKGNCSVSFIDQFKALHQCNKYCEILGLQSLKPANPKAKKPTPTKEKAQPIPTTSRKSRNCTKPKTKT